MKLLIVDDSFIIRNAIERLVCHPEIKEIFQAENGIAALEIYQRESPQLVTMDLTMPHMDGLGCLEEIQHEGKPVSIMVISAINSHRTAMDAVSRGACGFLVKPFTSHELIEAMNELVEHARENGTQP